MHLNTTTFQRRIKKIFPRPGCITICKERQSFYGCEAGLFGEKAKWVEIRRLRD
jgi:hypothetical protein